MANEHSPKDLITFASGVTFDVKSGIVSPGRPIDSIEAADSDGDVKIEFGYNEAVPQLQLSLTYACNMSCSYCSFRDRMRSDGRPVNMSLAVANRAIDFFVDNAKSNVRYARIDFGLTGETLLRRHLHETLLEQIGKSFEATGVKMVWAGPNVTNGTLALDPEIAESMGPPQDISCDGPKEVHDAARPYVGGGGTYDDLLQAIRVVLEKHPDIGVSAVLTARYTNFDEIFLHLHEVLGFKSVYMKPVNTPHDVDYGLNIDTLPLFMEGYTKLVDLFLSQPQEKMLEYLMCFNSEDYFMRFFYRVKDRARQIYRCGAGKSGAYVDTDGKLYPCAHFIGKTGWHIGDIYNGYDEHKREQYLSLHVDMREPCKSCWARYLCGGGCYYQAALANGDIGAPDLVKCDLIRHLSSEAIRLFTALATDYPNVLSALPGPYFIPQQDLRKPSDQRYFPSSKCESVDQSRIEVIRPGRIEGAILPETASGILSLAHNDSGLEITIEWDDDSTVDEVRFWFLDLENDPYLMGDLPVVKPEMKGTLLRLDKSGTLYEIVHPNEGQLRKVPYEETQWSVIDEVPAKYHKNGVRVSAPLSRIFKGRIPQTHYGFNLFIGFSNGGRCSLVRYEPFCLIRVKENGWIEPRGGEFQLSARSTGGLNASPVEGMEPLGRWSGLQANVC